MSDSRFRVYIDIDTWVLVIQVGDTIIITKRIMTSQCSFIESRGAEGKIAPDLRGTIETLYVIE